MALYEELKARNIFRLIKDMVREGVLDVRIEDGKIVPMNLRASFQTPWLHHKGTYRHNCFIFKDILFDRIVMTKLDPKDRFVPSHCQRCFKIVVRPRTLKELFALAALQYAMDVPSKCGLELRHSVHGMWGGYFYTIGKEEGQARYEQVRKLVDEHISPDVKVLLKRSCTEMEHAIGPSDEWVVTELQKSIEDLIDQYFIKDMPVIDMQTHIREHVQLLWIEEAYKHGDPTVWEYIDGPLYPDYVTYHKDSE